MGDKHEMYLDIDTYNQIKWWNSWSSWVSR